MDHFRARCMLGFDLKPRSHHQGEGPGLLGAAIYSAISWIRLPHAVSRTRRWMSLPAKLFREGLLSASSTHDSLAAIPACHVPSRLRRRLLYFRPRCGVAERLIDLASHPKSMQQDRQLPCYRYRGSLLRVLSPTLAQPQSITS